MRGQVRGFSLIELLLAMAVGLILVLGVSQVAISARATHASQQAAMLLQDDARFVLGKLIQDIRQAGMGNILNALLGGVIFNASNIFSINGSSRSG